MLSEDWLQDFLDRNIGIGFKTQSEIHAFYDILDERGIPTYDHDEDISVWPFQVMNRGESVGCKEGYFEGKKIQPRWWDEITGEGVSDEPDFSTGLEDII